MPGECRAPAALVLTAVLGAHALPHDLFAGVLAEGLFWPSRGNDLEQQHILNAGRVKTAENDDAERTRGSIRR